MLITKGEVKKAGKKLLSVLLAIIMIMSTMSVSFATLASAAYDEDPIDYLAEHLKHPVVEYISKNFNYTYSGSAGNSNKITLTTNITLPTWEYYVEARDLLIYLEKAIKSCKEWDYPTKYTDDMQARTCTSAGLIEAQILGSLGNISDYAKEFISFVLEDSRATQHSSANTSQNKVPASHTATVTISTSDIKGYLNSVEGDYTTVESGFDVSYKYVFKMDRGYYQVSKSSGLSKTSYYHNYVKGSDNTNSPVVNGTNTTIKTTVNNYVSNLDAKIAAYPFDTLALLTTENIDKVLGEIYTLRTNIKSEVNSDSYPKNYDKLFPNEDAKITAFEETCTKAKELASYTPTAEAIKAYQTANPNYGVFNWGGFDEATIKADYKTFVDTYRTILEDETLYEFFTDNGVFSAAYIDNFHDNVVAYDLRDTKIAADALYNEYAVAHPDLGDEEPAELTLAEKQVVYGALTGYINSYNTYTNQVKNAIFEGGIDYLLNLQEHFQCQVDESIIYFAENVNKDYTDVSTEKVIEEIATAKNQLAALNALKSSVDFVENLTLLDTPFANADTFITYLYSLLGERFTNQVNAADDMYNSLGRPNSNLKIEQYSKLNALVNGIERDIVTFIGGEGQGALITQATRDKLAALDNELMPAFNAFELDRGFTNFSKQEVTITREDSLDEFFRQNENLDDDMLGEYKVTDENVNAIIDLLEAALKDETVKGLLGDLINKDENGNPTGEAFSLSGLITGLLNDVVFTDELLNTIVQFLYPLVLKEFAKVWAGLPETITVVVENVSGDMDANVLAGLSLIDVETAIEGVGLALGPQSLARALEKNATWKTQYANVISALKEVQIKPSYNASNDNFRDPWADEVLFKDVIDETTGEPVINEETGEVKQAYKMSWGINEAENKREAFVDAAVAALTGVEPLLLALLTNKAFSNDTTGTVPRGFAIGTAAGSAKVDTGIFGITLTFSLDVNPITLTLTFSANDGWDNALCPIFEALGLTGLKHSEDLQSVRKFLEDGLLSVIDQLVSKLDSNPLEFILDALPNICYLIDSGMIMPLLNELKTVINYFADAHYKTSGGIALEDNLKEAMKSEEPINIIIGDMLKDTLPDLSSFSAIWNLLSGVELLAGVEAPDAAKIATLGTLVPKNTNASKKVYTADKVGNTTLGANQAWYIQANRADVLEYLISWLLESGLLSGLVAEPSELIATIFANLENNSTDAVAAIVELLNQQAYPAKDYNWFNGYNGKNESVLGNSAMEIYMNPNNDWTEAKAQYLYENIDTLLTSILTMAGAEFDLGAMISDGIDGLLTDKTLTSLAALLAKLDLNALLAGDAEAEETPEANEPETVAEGEEATEGEAAAPAVEIDVNALVKEYLGLDFAAIAAEYADIAAAVEADAEYVYDFGVDAGTSTFVAELVKMLAPLDKVLAFLLDGGNLEITIGEEKVTLLGSNGYNNAIVPLLEALGCTISTEGTSLEKTLNALLTRIDALTTGDVIKNIIDILPGAFYFIASNGLATAVLNLLQPVLVIVDTIRPVIDVMGLISAIEIGEADENGVKKTLVEFLGGEAGDKLDIAHLDLDFIFNLLPALVPALADIDLSGLKDVIYDICFELATPYTSASTLIGENGKKGAYSDDFSQADLLTVVLSFVLEWATIEDNAKALDALLGVEEGEKGIISSLNKVFEDVEITYGTPNWMYYFEGDEEAFDDYIAEGSAALPNTLAAIDWENMGDNDWDLKTAQYFAENIDVLVDLIIGMINKDKADAPKTVSALVNGLISGYINADTLNNLVGLIAGLLENVDDNLLGLAGYILGDSSTDKKEIDIVGLKKYTCDKEITTISEFAAELANVLDTYASGVVNWLFFGDDFRFAKKSDKNDTIVINGGKGYEMGLAMILEALGADAPAVAEATTANVLAALATRVEAILANPVDEVIGLLPNLVYFLNANGAGVAVSNLLAPVNALLDKLAAFGLEVNLADLLKITKEDGTEIAIDLAKLSTSDVVTIVEGATGLELAAAEDILVNFCLGKIEKGDFIYKMSADKEDVITTILYTAVKLIYDDDFANSLNALLGVEFIDDIKSILEGTDITYTTPNWNYMEGKKNEGVIEYVNAIASYPNDWTEDKAIYLADNLPALVDTVIGMIEINGVKYESLADLLAANVNIFTTANIQSILDLVVNLLADIDEGLLEVGFILDVDLAGLKKHTVAADIDTVTEFADELSKILAYIPGVVEWLLLGRDFTFLVDYAKVKVPYNKENALITISGAHGYAEGLALLLEALGCEDLPAVYDVEKLDTNDTVKAVLNSLAARIDEIFANPVEEVLDILPNLVYFLEANGVAAVIENTTAALMGIVNKLEPFGVELDINALVDLPKLMGIADKYAEGEAKLGLNNLTITALLKAVSLMTGLDLSELEAVLVPFAVGKAVEYNSVSSKTAYKMVYAEDRDKHDMISVIVSAALRVVFETEGNAAKLGEMLGTDIIEKLNNVFAASDIAYTAPTWDYPLDENGTVDAMKYSITYPNNWTEETAAYVTGVLESAEFDALIASLIEGGKYESLGALLTDKVNVFTSDNLQAIVDLIANLLEGIDDGLLDAAGVLLGVKVVELKAYKAPEGITTVDAFAAELANVLNTYAKGVVEWFLLGNDYTFFVKEVKDGLPVDFITINGAEGYANGLALLLEALGCENLPAADGNTEDIVSGVLASLAARIDDILSNDVDEEGNITKTVIGKVIDLLPNLIYFLNTNGVAAVVDNTLAAINPLLEKLSYLGIDVNINELVDLKALLNLPAEAKLSLDNLSMDAVLEAVSYLVDGLDLTLVKDVLVNFALGEVNAYTSVSDAEAVGTAKKMAYTDKFGKQDMVTVLVNIILLTIADENNAEFVKGLVGEDVYKVILGLFNMTEVPVQEFSWLYTDRVGEVLSVTETSENYDPRLYGPMFNEEMANYIADNFGELVNNIIYLLGIQINGENVNNLNDLIDGLLNGSLYNSENVVAIRDALAGVLAGIKDLEVSGVKVGGYIVDVLKTSGVADLDAVGKVKVAEFTEDREAFVAALCDVLEPLYPVLKYLLADEDFSFFVNVNKTDAITLKGAEGYAFGIIPLLEALGCKDILTSDAYVAAVKADGDVLLTSILNPLLNRVDEILADDPAQAILDMLPNIIYFINSNGLDTVVKNTLNAVYTLLAAIEPIAKIDLYDLIGIDLADINFEWIINKLLEVLKNAGYEFTAEDLDCLAELTVGKVEEYTSANGKTAYRMVYAEGESGTKAEMSVVIMRLAVTFVGNEANAVVIENFLKNELGMSDDAAGFVKGVIELFGELATETYIGMDQALALIYYLFYGIDVGVDNTVGGYKDLNAAWGDALDNLETSSPTLSVLLIKFLDQNADDVLTEDGVAPNGFIAFFQKIADWFNKIIEWFKNLFN